MGFEEPGSGFPSAFRNRLPILEVWKSLLTSDMTGRVLEVASGNGVHLAYFAPHFPNLVFHPTELGRFGDTWPLEEINERVCDIDNIVEAEALDLTADEGSWPQSVRDSPKGFNIAYASNLCHVTAYEATVGFFRVASHALVEGGTLLIYGAFNMPGVPLTNSGKTFDALLKAANPKWGIRDLSVIQETAASFSFKFREARNMPANNYALVFVKLLSL
eukprot:TRINITY_DN38262_c0_g1_i1.p1 TRINITY_DN38262_c0_g1~~TRINITY_DN38262_c0_g1_i1.p1  ORF type:complete len:218 (-),score=31.21 TRINITY_DN38262_c0_g1_i1:83-736(-)